jgi:hypothetical protein
LPASQPGKYQSDDPDHRSDFGGREIAVYKRTNSVLFAGIQPRKLFGNAA